MARILLIFLLILSDMSDAQIITTLAGNGMFGCCLDGKHADSAKLYNPTGVAVDKDGNVFIADFGNSRIRKIDTLGIISTYAGSLLPGYSGDGGQATAAQLNQPWGITIDKIGDIFFTEYANNVVRKVDTSGIITTIAGNGIIGYFGDGGPATAAEFHHARGISVDTLGNVFIADPKNNAIRKVNTFGIITTFAGTGVAGYTGDGVPATAAGLSGPFDVCADKSGNLFIADWDNFRIRKVDAAGIITTIAGNGIGGYGGDGLLATAAKIIPVCLAADDSGNVYFADAVDNVIRKVNKPGIVSTIAGNNISGYSGDGGYATAAQLNSPYGIAGNDQSNIYIADQQNNRVRKVTWLFTASFISNLDTTCQDSCIRFINTSSGSVDSIRWFVDGTTLANPYSDTLTVCFPIAGNDTMMLYVYGNGRVDTAYNIVTIKPAPHPHVSDTPCCSVPNAYLSYQWYAIGGSPVSGATNNFFVGGMGAWFVVVDSGGCLGTSDTGWVYEGINGIYAPNPQISIFPNPATAELTIMATDKITTVVINNLLGQTLFSQLYNSFRVQIDIADLPADIYLIRINDTEVRKFLKE